LPGSSLGPTRSGTTLAACTRTTPTPPTATGEQTAHAESIRVQTQGHCSRLNVLRIHHGIVRDQEYAGCLGDLDLDLAIHTGFQKSQVVIERHDHGKHRDILLHHGLGLDLVHDSEEAPVRERLYVDNGFHAFPDFAHVGLVD
jgi:hypothetical protein